MKNKEKIKKMTTKHKKCKKIYINIKNRQQRMNKKIKKCEQVSSGLLTKCVPHFMMNNKRSLFGKIILKGKKRGGKKITKQYVLLE